MSVGRVDCASTGLKCKRLIANSRNASRKTTSRMAHNVTQHQSTDYADFLSVESVQSVVKGKPRDPSLSPNSSAGVCDHRELSFRLRASAGYAQRCGAYVIRRTNRRR